MQFPSQTLMFDCPKTWHKKIEGTPISTQDFHAQKRKLHTTFKPLLNMSETFPFLQQHCKLYHQKPETRQLDKHGNYADTDQKQIL